MTSAPYGAWSSPITADAITEGATSVTDVLVDAVTSAIYHIESRPSEAGRAVLVNTSTGKDVVGKDWNVRSGVQEYGGAPAIVHDGIAYFSHVKDNRLYRIKEGASSEPEAITPESSVHRFANLAIFPKDTALIVAILEDHTVDTPSQVVTTLAVIDTRIQKVTTVASGADFYAAPAFSPDGQKLAYQSWWHPDMPWEGAEIHTSDVVYKDDTILLQNDVYVAGKKKVVSTAYPQWISNDTLLFTSDESGYQNPWVFKEGSASALLRSPIFLDFCEPAWQLGNSPFALIGDKIIFAAMEGGRNVLYLVDLTGASPVKLDAPYVDVKNIRSLDDRVVFVGGKADASANIVALTLNGMTPTFESLKLTVSANSPTQSFPEGIVSIPMPISLKVPPNDEPLHVVYYAPTNPAYSGTSVQGELPPCVISVHGGPTSVEGQSLKWSKQYYTSRGWAWVDVNYGGSSGYGRKYTDRLVGNWGIVDVEDCILAARSLSSAPHCLIDPKRVCIRGGSAGGFTVLAALSIAKDVEVFAAGTSSYGISDLRKLAEDTHKFESRYLEKLVGGTPDEIPDVFLARSPVFHAERIVSPLLILQGDLDKVVPKEQAEVIVKSMEDRGARVEYKLYDGEGHGWRQAVNIKDALEREIAFYEDVLALKRA